MTTGLCGMNTGLSMTTGLCGTNTGLSMTTGLSTTTGVDATCSVFGLMIFDGVVQDINASAPIKQVKDTMKNEMVNGDGASTIKGSEMEVIIPNNNALAIIKLRRWNISFSCFKYGRTLAYIDLFVKI